MFESSASLPSSPDCQHGLSLRLRPPLSVPWIPGPLAPWSPSFRDLLFYPLSPISALYWINTISIQTCCYFSPPRKYKASLDCLLWYCSTSLSPSSRKHYESCPCRSSPASFLQSFSIPLQSASTPPLQWNCSQQRHQRPLRPQEPLLGTHLP